MGEEGNLLYMLMNQGLDREWDQCDNLDTIDLFIYQQIRILDNPDQTQIMSSAKEGILSGGDREMMGYQHECPFWPITRSQSTPGKEQWNGPSNRKAIWLDY